MAKNTRRSNIRTAELEIVSDEPMAPAQPRNPRKRGGSRRRKKNPKWLTPVAIATGAIVAGALVTYGIRRYQRDRVPAQLAEMT